MDPLKDLSPLLNWTQFSPSTNAYKPPTDDDLVDARVTELLECLENLQPDGVVAGSSVATDAPTPGIIVNATLIRPPVTSSDFEHCRASGKSIIGLKGETLGFEVASNKLKITNPTWGQALEENVELVLGQMKAVATFETRLISLTALRPGQNQVLDTRRASDEHFATVVAVLPARRTLSFLEARHRGQGVKHNLNQSTLFSTHFFGFYTGIDRAFLNTAEDRVTYLTYHLIKTPASTSSPSLTNILGPRKEISTAFAGWYHGLAAGAKTISLPVRYVFYHLDGSYRSGDSVNAFTNPKDKLVLGYLAPPAKHYGFKILLAHASITQESETWLEQLPHNGAHVEYDANEYEMEDHGEIRTAISWTLTGLDGQRINHNELRDELDYQLRGEGWFLNGHLDLHDFADREVDVVESSSEADTLQLFSHKDASFLVIGPASLF